MSMISDLCEALQCQADYIKMTMPELKGTAKLIEDAIDTINTQSEKLHACTMERSCQYYHGGWIPVDERMPTLADDGYSDCYLVYTDSDNMCMAYWCGDDGWVFAEATNSKIKIDWVEVIAWQPLPEGYKKND